MLTSVIGVVVLLGGLIFFHELGHYTIAKLFGVKVEVFSLGFGKKLFRRRLGDTEYCLSLFPLGGYVKLMGDDPYKAVPAEEADRAFSTQKLYKRFLIVAAGPLANLLLAYLLFVAVFYFGQPMPGTRLGTVLVHSPAWEAGFRPEDRIVELFGKKVETWEQLEETLKGREGQKAEVVVDRAGAELRIPVSVTKVHAKNPYGEDEMVGGISGISSKALEPVVGISNPQSLAYAAGLRSDDEIIKIGTRSLNVYEDIHEALSVFWKEKEPVTFTVRRTAADADKVTEISFPVVLPRRPAPQNVSPLGLGEVLGLYPSELFVKMVTPGSAAEKAGLKPGDRIVQVDQARVFNFETIVDHVQEHGSLGQPVKLVVEREGKLLTVQGTPAETTQEDPLTRQPVKKYLLGYMPDASYKEPDMVKVKIHHPIRLFEHAASETYLLAKRMVISIVKLVAGQISPKNLGGPVLIASVAGKSLDAGIIPFIQMMALISINLFLLNLFPIPILDGGHLLFFAIEALKGKPVSLRTMEIANQVGMVFILALVGFTLFNDISRIVLH